MPTKTRTPKGSVKIKNSNGRLQLVFSHAGKRHYLSLHLPDKPVTRKAAKAKAQLIESDIAFDRFDPTLEKYKNSKSQDVDGLPQLPQLDELWEMFIEWKRTQCSPSTMKTQYRAFTGYVERLPHQDLNQVTEIRDWVVRNIPPESAKRFIVRLNACCKWAVDSGLLESNPFEGMAAQIKKPKSSNGDDINPFTKDERDRILHCLKTNASNPSNSHVNHSHYWPFVKFLFMTGCRPSEAVALQWKHINLSVDSGRGCGQITFTQGIVDSDEGKIIRNKLKTQKNRIFPVNQPLWDFLNSIKSEKAKKADKVFPAINGGWLNTGNFTKRVWPKVLEHCGIEYRKLYQCRHSFITWCLEAGIDAKDVARWVGNSPTTIYKHYAGKSDIAVPEL